ncbi:hypothetical protein ERD78_18650 [Allopusillimonas soli]|uniref:Adhesin n=1 Tax=Allopusillimonas soli TaxID=659016 RepID=A0A853FFQ7_9BURK|nr:hypothetical protein [Allopusillimonas soli]NYT38913.1 hypothetical protein [Allopusillimonas soli]TEA70089.1 hypothetical protein ERD78_18650 [Allopusillimonas soli]
MKSLIATVVFAFLTPFAFAHGNGHNSNNGGGVAGGIAVGGVTQGWTADASGTAKSATEGAAVAVGQVAGTGYSFQSSVANSGGLATIGGIVTPTTATVGTSTSQYANIATVGVTDQAALNADGLIQNGSIAQAQSINSAKGKASFEVGQIGGFLAVGGIAGVAGL